MDSDTPTAPGSTPIEVTWKGTQSGPLVTPKATIPPSGKPVHVRGVQVVTFRDDRIQEVRHYFDMMTLLRQIGAIPE